VAGRLPFVRTVAGEDPPADAGGVQRGLEPVFATGARREPERVAPRFTEEGDAAMPERQHVVRSHAPAAAVVDLDARQRRVRSVEDDRRERGLGEQVAVVGAERERQHDEARQVLIARQLVHAFAGPQRRIDVHHHDVDAVRLEPAYERL
jgi:hypothetical protein